ncbi:hypothetical protein [Aliarcobacter cryaerophilus]|uniref:hypothetical protein n=1 Tax=Aliarcobacter cryaerophilus TaxID=28198 RepID=UPI0008327D6C|nr:hypothetical protein [Aliarcobacter cryaerophilus]
MISPIQLGKTYGVLHTKSFFSFLGFAKKVGSDEIQKIDIFLDDKLIDTIEANEFIQKIDDMYDVENKAFKYNLSTQYIGKKAIISFKNHDSGEELLNSPYTLIDKNHEKFNEASFFNTLNFEFDNEKIQNINTKDSIGFLATEDNILNKDLIKLIDIFLEQNFETRFKAFYFNNEQKKLISEKFNKYQSKIDFIMPKDIYDIANNTSIYIHSSTENEKPKSFGYWKTWGVLNQTKANMFLINIFEAIDEKEYSKSLKLIDNYKIGFEKSIVSKIFENDERYNEFRFINSINQPISEEMKNMYNPNSIGFLAIKENLEDEVFTKFVHEISEIFPNNKIIVYGFNDSHKKLLQKKFPQSNNIIFVILKNLTQIVKDINIWIESASVRKGKLFNYLLYDAENILCFNIENNMNISLKELSNTDRFRNHLYVKYPDFFHFKNASGNLFEILFNEMNISYDGNMLYKDFIYKHIEYNLNNQTANKLYTQRVNKLRDFINNKI